MAPPTQYPLTQAMTGTRHLLTDKKLACIWVTAFSIIKERLAASLDSSLIELKRAVEVLITKIRPGKNYFYGLEGDYAVGLYYSSFKRNEYFFE